MNESSPIRSGVEGEAPALGQKVTERGRRLDVFNSPKNHSKTTYYSDEVTALCPVTGQPDWYEVHISIDDTSDLLIESKSLKLYLQSFRDSGMFAEAFAAQIAHDTAQAVQNPTFVTVRQKPRGGVAIDTSSWGDYEPHDPEEANIEAEREVD